MYRNTIDKSCNCNHPLFAKNGVCYCSQSHASSRCIEVVPSDAVGALENVRISLILQLQYISFLVNIFRKKKRIS